MYISLGEGTVTKRWKGHELSKATGTGGQEKGGFLNMHTITDGYTSTAASSSELNEGRERKALHGGTVENKILV